MRRVLILAVLALLAWTLWAGSRAATPASRPLASEPPRPAGERGRPAPSVVTTLYAEDTSAYGVQLWADEDAAVLVTPVGLSLFRPGLPPERHALELGPIAARQGASVVYFSAGKLRRVSLSGQHERDVAALPRPPQYLLASESQLAWIHARREAGTSMHDGSGDGARVVYGSADTASAALLHGSVIYSVLQRRDGSWRVGRIPLAGGSPTLTTARGGRPPAMLAAGPDGIYFYAGLERGVRRLSFDLEREDVVVTNAICSPLAVSSRVICAQVGGLFEVASSGEAPRLLALEPAGPIAALAATNDRAFWVAESGERRLSLKTVALAAP